MPLIIKSLFIFILITDLIYFSFKFFRKINLTRFDLGFVMGQIISIAFVGLIIYRQLG